MSLKPKKRSTVIGILGGGQLGRMTALAAANLGIKSKCLDPNERAPAGKLKKKKQKKKKWIYVTFK